MVVDAEEDAEDEKGVVEARAARRFGSVRNAMASEERVFPWSLRRRMGKNAALARFLSRSWGGEAIELVGCP